MRRFHFTMTYASGPSFSLFSADSRRSGVIPSCFIISLYCYAYRRRPSVAVKSGPYGPYTPHVN